MPATSARADRLVERIDAGEIDPETVDVSAFLEDRVALTPELAESLPTHLVESYNDQLMERYAAELDSRTS